MFNNFDIVRDGFQITPFVHFNFLCALDIKSAYSKEEFNPFYFSTGFGVNLLTEAITVEFYYNAYIKKNVNDIGSEFSLNFGLD